MPAQLVNGSPFIKNLPYDRCVFHCDNNVVDHQSTIMLFENGKTAVHGCFSE